MALVPSITALGLRRDSDHPLPTPAPPYKDKLLPLHRPAGDRGPEGGDSAGAAISGQSQSLHVSVTCVSSGEVWVKVYFHTVNMLKYNVKT